jgi:hypothetical protein
MRHNVMTAPGALLIVGVSALLWAGPGFGQTAASPPQTAQAKQADVDEDDPNSLLWAMQRAGSKSGWQRGQEIYYMKCWMCHNEYTIAADTAPPAPSLRDLFKRPLVGGQPVNDQNVAAYIRRGSSRMPAYTTAVRPTCGKNAEPSERAVAASMSTIRHRTRGIAPGSFGAPIRCLYCVLLTCLLVVTPSSADVAPGCDAGKVTLPVLFQLDVLMSVRSGSIVRSRRP